MRRVFFTEGGKRYLKYRLCAGGEWIYLTFDTLTQAKKFWKRCRDAWYG